MPRNSAQGSARITDVARIAGVSTATVSRTLSNPDIVSEATRRAVLDAVQTTGYSANLSARNLRRRRTGGVMALAPNLANPFFSEILAGMSAVLRAHGLNLIVADTQTGETERRQLVDYADRARTDGLLVLDGRLDPTLFRRRQCPPVVQVCEEIAGLDAPAVIADNAGGSRAALRHLHEQGYTRPARLRGPGANSLTRGRDAGIAAGLAETGLTLPEARIVTGDFSFETGRAAAPRIAALEPRPDAVLCDNDQMACGLMGALIQMGLRVPRDVAVIGFDDIELAVHLTPALSTVRQDRHTIGTEAARILLAAMDGTETPARRIVPTTLVARASTLRPL